MQSANDKNTSPIVSICCLAYNQEMYIRDAIEGFLMQKTTFPIEIIIHDDASTDRTAEIIREYEAKYPELFVCIYQKENQHSKGIRPSPNYVWPKTRGKYIALCEGDDYWTDPYKLQKQIDFLDNQPEYVLCFHNAKILDLIQCSERLFCSPMQKDTTEITDLIKGNYIPTASVVYRNGIIDHFPKWYYDLGFGDWTLYILLAQYGKVKYLSDIMAVYRNHGNGTWSSKSWIDQTKITFKGYSTINKHFEYKYDNIISESVQNTLKAHYFEALNLFKNKSYEEALVYFEDLLQLMPNNPEILHNKALTLSKLREFTREENEGDNEQNYEKFKILAIISAYNEGDVIYHVIGNLISNGADVYLINNSSTDDTVEEAGKWLGKGLLHIENFPEDSGFPIRSSENYVWRDILRRKEQIALEIKADWYIHADADEFRESPFPDTTLAEGIFRVDQEGYNAINFELLNFRPINNSFVPHEDVRNYLTKYEMSNWYDTNQVKAWKNTGEKVDLVSSGGHLVNFQGRKIYPIPFILRHYPIRSESHGQQKINKDRLPRFSKEEREIGWHVQYDEMIKSNKPLIWKAGDLIEYNSLEVKRQIISRANKKALLLESVWGLETISLEEVQKMQQNNVPVLSRLAYLYMIVNDLDTSQLLINKIFEVNKENPFAKKLAILQDQINKSKNSIEISIVIPVFNNCDYTDRCLKSLFEISTHKNNFEVIIIDNASTDNTEKIVEKYQKEHLNVKYYKNKENLCFAKACNQGAMLSDGKYILFLNNDTQVLPGWDNALITTFAKDQNIGIQGGKLLYPNNTIQHAGIVYGPVKSGMNLHYHIYLCSPKDAPCVNKLREFQMVTGAMLAIRKDVFEKVKGFDENYQFGHEDLDLCLSVRKEGYKVIYNPKAAAYHFESMTKKQQGLEKFALNLSDTRSMDYKNYKYFHEKWDEFLFVDADKYYIEDGFKKPLDSASLEKPKTKGKSILFTMYGWNESGGGTIFPKDVTKELVKRGYSVSVFYASLKNDSQMPPYSMEKTIEDGVRLYGLYNRPAPFIDPDNPEREVSDPNIEKVFTQVLKEVKPDVLHFNNFHGLTLSLPRVAREHGIHSCYTPHNYHMIDPNLYLFNNDLSLWDGVDLLKNSEAVKRNPGKLQGYKKRILTAQKLMNEWVDVTIAVSSRQKQLLCEFGADKNKIAVVHQSNKSTDTLWNDNLLQEQQDRSLHSPVRIGFIGGVMPHKGVHMLVSAAQAFPKEKAEFHIYGFVSAEYLKLLNEIDKKHIVKFHGEFKQDQLSEIAGQMDIAVVPSIWEDCAPLVLLELLAMRLPIIAAEIGGIPDFVKDGVTGFLYKHDSVDDLKKVIAYCMDNPEKILAIRKSLKQEHSFVKYVDHIERIYSLLQTKNNVRAEDCDLVIGKEYADTKQNLRIKWEGSIFVHHSLALVNREMTSRLAKEDVELSLIPYEKDNYKPKAIEPAAILKEYINKSIGSADIHVRHQWPPNLTAPESGRWVIIQPWEFGCLPEKWVEVFSSQVDEMWVPSSYVRDLYISSGVPAERVFVVPNGFDEKMFNPKNKPYKLSTKKKFKFLFVGGTIYRKGIDILLETYVKTFRKSDNVCLVIKDMGGESFYKGQTFREKIAEIKKEKDAPEIEYIDKMLGDKELAGLYTSCDVLVHPYRGEGFGLPILEAMASGTPAIVTNGGACLDFCNESNSILISADKKYLSEKKVGDLRTVSFPWFYEVKQEELAEKMNYAVNNPKAIKELGKKAAEFVHSNFTWENAFKKLKERVEILKNLPIKRMEINCMGELLPRINSEIERNEYESALADIKSAVELIDAGRAESNETDKGLLLNLAGNISLVLQDLENAKLFFEKELQYNPHSSTACQGLADVFNANEEYSSAKVMYEWAVKNDPENGNAVESLARVNLELGYDEYHSSLNEITEESETTENPEVNEFESEFNLAYQYFTEQNYQDALLKLYEAEMVYDETLAAQSSIDLEDASVLRGSIYLILNEDNKARLSFEKALSLNPQSSEACHGLAEIFFRAAMIEEARTMFEWALKNNPENEAANNRLNTIAGILGQVSENNSADDNPSKKEVESAISTAYELYQNRQFNDSISKLLLAGDLLDDLEHEAEKNEFTSVIENMKGMNYLGVKKVDKAKASFSRALELNPQSSQACAGLGEVFYLCEMDKEAKTMYEWALKNDETNQFALTGLKKVNKLLGYEDSDNSLLN